MKNSITISLLVIVFTTTTLAFELTCSYETNTGWWAINNVYFCELKHDIESSKLKNAVVTSVTGCHWNENSDRDVVGFRAYNKNLQYFPKGLGKYFNAEKIEFIAVWSSGLKEIHKSDLSPFTNMKVLSLWDNDFEVIERDLLKFNTQIEYIGLGKIKIKIVDGNVFGHLKKLHTLHIDGNVCISRQVAGDRDAVLELLEEIEEKCKDENKVEEDSEAPGSDFDINVRIDSS